MVVCTRPSALHLQTVAAARSLLKCQSRVRHCQCPPVTVYPAALKSSSANPLPSEPLLQTASGSNVRKLRHQAHAIFPDEPSRFVAVFCDSRIGDRLDSCHCRHRRKASGDHVWDSAVKWKDALRRHRSSESRRRYGETFVPSETFCSSFSPKRNDTGRQLQFKAETVQQYFFVCSNLILLACEGNVNQPPCRKPKRKLPKRKLNPAFMRPGPA